ncbi:MAG: hypothetical protein COA79_21050 [Planctomycetota bacterium]|nr:MAG: hypothetical protein COA79_21050 [Planctomycetota bacterium]
MEKVRICLLAIITITLMFLAYTQYKSLDVGRFVPFGEKNTLVIDTKNGDVYMQGINKDGASCWSSEKQLSFSK